jgi:hypothetical protein
VRERLRGQGEPGRAREPALESDLVEDRLVPRGVDDDADRLEVLCGRADHRRAADVDLLDRLVQAGSARDRLAERIQIHDDEVERLDPALAELLDVLR